MGDGFKRFKRKLLTDAVVKSVLAFFSAFLFMFAVFLFLADRDVLKLELLYIALIAVVSALVLGAVTFFISFYTDKRLAKRLDKELGLNEKIQTMYAFRNDDGEMKALQREDAVKRLDSAPTKMSSLLKAWIAFGAVLLVAIILFVAALLTYLEEETLPPPPPISSNPDVDDSDNSGPTEDNIDDHYKLAVQALIEYVEKSYMQKEAKELVIAELSLLLIELDSHKTLDPQLKSYVVGVIKNIRGIVNSINSTFAFRLYGKDSANEGVQKLSLAFYSLDIETIEKALKETRDGLYVDGDIESVSAIKDELGAVMKNSGISDDDKLYLMLKGICDALGDILDHPTYNSNKIIYTLDRAFMSDAFNLAKGFIPQQKNNENTKAYAVSELMRIFGITDEDLEESVKEDDSVETVEPEERPEKGDAGFGTGNILIGGEDTVIDPTKDVVESIDDLKVRYSDVIGRYSSDINELINGGEISQELAELLRKYLTAIGTQTKEEK